MKATLTKKNFGSIRTQVDGGREPETKDTEAKYILGKEKGRHPNSCTEQDVVDGKPIITNDANEA